MTFEDVTIENNDKIASGLWKMKIHAPLIASMYKGAGQFIQIQLNKNWRHPLRRPMSIAGVTNNTLSIIYKIFGSGTTVLSQKVPGDKINILGPLGNIFKLYPNHSHILVGGGAGLAPIINQWNQFNENNKNNYLLIGAKTRGEHILSHDPQNHIYLTTNDGSIGTLGTVMKTLKELCNSVDNPAVIACGPKPMLTSIQSYVSNKSIPTQMAVESYMGCGVGICQGCVISRKNNKEKTHSYHEKYSLVCIDGPVYNVGEITFD
ncbi:MAG: hypothetical protein QF814_03965 [Candidatus Marinimicrobia bacterium]|jgi:dihydroorotate dehydrogenase electron transfer subunit|nr:hypothetical protein [Candidatus Neomarinimicrobiota bacterium]|tara:strand:- start:2628 stop:3416 length:789 start_codon:yes stop_codon:yes gene_type:complete